MHCQRSYSGWVSGTFWTVLHREHCGRTVPVKTTPTHRAAVRLETAGLRRGFAVTNAVDHAGRQHTVPTSLEEQHCHTSVHITSV